MRPEEFGGRRSTSLAVLAILLALGAVGAVHLVSAAAETGKSKAATRSATAPKGFVQDIEALTAKNEDFRHVLYTAPHSQLVLMALKPGEEIGKETHKAVDQFFRVEEGTGEVVLEGVTTPIKAGFAVVVPSGMKHNIVNTGTVPLKLYTIYSPPNHRDGVVHHTRAEAEGDEEHFEGETSE